MTLLWQLGLTCRQHCRQFNNLSPIIKLAEANGSTDPTYSAWYTHNSSTNNPNGSDTLGVSVSIPLRIFDKNQGEKKRTLIDIDRSQQASEAARAQVFGDVDTAYELVRGNIALLKPYKAKYNDQALLACAIPPGIRI